MKPSVGGSTRRSADVRREHFEHVVAAAANIVGEDEFVVIGSQAILGSHPKIERPRARLGGNRPRGPIGRQNARTVRVADAARHTAMRTEAP